MDSMEKLYNSLRENLGERVFKASEAPPVRVISSGVTSLDVATGVGGFPRGTVAEIYGRESSGKSALAYSVMGSVLRKGGHAGLIHIESSPFDPKWFQQLAGVNDQDMERMLIVEARPHSESVATFGQFVASGGFDVVTFDSIGAMSTDKELEVGESKQAFGQSGLVTQMVKQAAKYAYDNRCVPIFVNQIRDEMVGTYLQEKAPGGHAKDHFATLRIHLKPSNREKAEAVVNGEKIQIMFRVNAKVVKNKVSAPRKTAGWNFWNLPSPEGTVGIDKFQDTVDVALRMGLFERAGAWYRHEKFPDGKLNGGAAVTKFLRENPDVMEEVRRELVMIAFHNGNQPEDREVLADA